MSSKLVWAPLVAGTVIAGALLVFALVALVTSSTRWDDHLINAIGVFLAASFVSVTLRLAVNVFRPRPGTGRGARVISILLLVALVVVVGLVATVAWFFSNMSFV